MFDVLSALASTVMRMSVSRLLAERDESGRQRVKQRETAQSVPRTSRAFEAVCHTLAELQRGALGGGVAADAGALSRCRGNHGPLVGTAARHPAGKAHLPPRARPARAPQ